jgi:hypothetical protein
MLVYATTSDLATFTDPIPDNAAALLRTASLRVREATKAARYDVDVDGLPTDATILQAFKDATCTHAAAMVAAKVDPGAGGVVTKAATAASKSVGSANITYAGTKEAAASLTWLAGNLAPDAAAILSQAGLIPATVWTVG